MLEVFSKLPKSLKTDYSFKLFQNCIKTVMSGHQFNHLSETVFTGHSLNVESCRSHFIMMIVGSSPLSDLGTQSLLLLKLPKHFDIILNLTCLMYLPSRTTVSSRGVFAHLENRLLILFFHLPTMSFCQDHYCSQWCGRPRRCNPKVFPKMSTQMRRAWTWSNDSSFRWWQL